jgi:DNA-binding transcriptional MocR family regulator
MGPRDLIERLVGSGLLCMGGGANPLAASIVATYCEHGLLEPHIEGLRQAYRQRRDVALTALEEHMPPGVHWTRPGGGFFIWITLPSAHRAVDVVQRAKEAGVWILPGEPFFAEMPTGQHLRLAFSYLGPESIQQGIKSLASVLGDQSNKH